VEEMEERENPKKVEDDEVAEKRLPEGEDPRWRFPTDLLSQIPLSIAATMAAPRILAPSCCKDSQICLP